MRFFQCVAVGSSLVLAVATAAFGDSFSKVDADIAQYDASVIQMNREFGQVTADPGDKGWVIKKLQHMVDTDQYMRKFPFVIFDHQYTREEQTYFYTLFGPRWQQLDQQNTTDLQALLVRYSWFTVSEFGAEADQNAWLLVQHADQEPAFQREVLLILEKLYRVGETKPANYAYLYDRVAASFSDPTQSKPQRYGTQGSCVGAGKWEPLPIEDASNVDVRRASVGLSTMSEYIDLFKDICK